MSIGEPIRYAHIVAADGYVCGIGADPASARADALRNMGELNDGTIYDIRPCTPALEALFRAQGGDISYDDPDGVLTPFNDDTSPEPAGMRLQR